MKSNKSSSARRCEHCERVMKRTAVDLYRRRHERHVLFQDVPALVCPSCGYRVFEAAAVEAMEYSLNQARKARRTARLEIIKAVKVE